MPRPRSIEVHEKMIHVALRLFSERGFDATSMEAIARQAGVSKPTLYNHWADKEALMMDVMRLVNGLDRDQPDIDTGNLVRDLTTILTRRPPDEFGDVRDRMMPGLIAYSASHPQFGAAWRQKVTERSRKSLGAVLARAIQRRQLPPDLNYDVAFALLLGPMLYNHIFRAPGLEIDQLGRTTAEAFCRAFMQKSKSR